MSEQRHSLYFPVNAEQDVESDAASHPGTLVLDIRYSSRDLTVSKKRQERPLTLMK